MRSSATSGKIPLRRASVRPALITRRQAGACTWGRTPRQTHTDTGTHAGEHAGPAPVALLQAPSLAGAARVSGSQRRSPPATLGSHGCAGGRAACIGRATLREAGRGRRWEQLPGAWGPCPSGRAGGTISSPLVSSCPSVAISISFSPSFINSSFPKTFSHRYLSPAFLSQRCLAGKG